MGAFSGTLGGAIGYLWNGKWCMRSRPSAVHNPRTPEQVAHREMFKREVQLAAELRWAVVESMSAMAREMGMTAYNHFVSVNQAAFSGQWPVAGGQQAGLYSSTTAKRRSPSPNLGEEPGLLQSRQGLSSSSPETGEGDPNTVRGEEYDMKTNTKTAAYDTFSVDWRNLRVSLGDLVPVENARMELKDNNVLEVKYDKGHGYTHDLVRMVVYAPGLRKSVVSKPSFRKDKKIRFALPDSFEGEELQVWLTVQSPDGRWSESVYVENEELGVRNEELGVGEEAVDSEELSAKPTAHQGVRSEELSGAYSSQDGSYSSTTAERRSPSPILGEEPDSGGEG